jgi:acyl-CoA thioesterase YciA
MPDPSPDETLTHRLILPRDANHYGTLFAGELLSLALEAAYSTAYRTIGASANLVLKRVLDVRCFEPVQVGRVIEIRGREVHRARAMVIIALYGTPLPQRPKPWMDCLMQFVQVDPTGRPIPIEGEISERPPALSLPWGPLRDRAIRLLAIRGGRT